MAAQSRNPEKPFYVPDKPFIHLVDVSPREYFTDRENIWTWDVGKTEFRVVLYAGFNTDIASVPGLWGLSRLIGFTRDGPWRRAAVLHDLLYLIIKLYGGMMPAEIGRYEIKINGVWVRATSQWNRKQADDMFLHFMLLDGVPVWKARVMHRAVRTFGGINLKFS